MRKEFVCTNCYHIGVPKTAVRGSAVVEILLWFCLLVPGLIYTIWRAGGAYKACRQCGGDNLVPADSPRGQEIRKMTKLG